MPMSGGNASCHSYPPHIWLQHSLNAPRNRGRRGDDPSSDHSECYCFRDMRPCPEAGALNESSGHFSFLCMFSLYPCTPVFLCHGRHSSEPYACRRHPTTLVVCNDNFMTPRRAPTCSSHNAPGIWQAGRGLEPHCLMRVHAPPSPNAGAGVALTAGRMESAAGSCVPQIWSFDQKSKTTRIVRHAVKTSH